MGRSGRTAATFREKWTRNPDLDAGLELRHELQDPYGITMRGIRRASR